MDMPTGLQHQLQPVGMMTELTQKLARKGLEEREEKNKDDRV